MPDGPEQHAKWMHRALQLARNGMGQVAPNPMVGAVLVRGDRCLAEGWHGAYGGPHAEVVCLSEFGGAPLPADAVLYVNLEPCSHHGKTPPCIDLLIQRGLKRLVVAHADPDPVVNGRGLARANEAGMHVEVGVLADEARWLNRRFLSLHERGRPYVILKWARSADGYLDDHGRTARISSPPTDVLVHRWRSEEQAILVGGRTVINDDPQLTVRHVNGRSPVRIVLDRFRRTAPSSRVFDKSARTMLVTEERLGTHAADTIVHPRGLALHDSLEQLLRTELASAAFLAPFGLPRFASLLVEGGATVLSAFLASGLWDEARVITGTQRFGGGTTAPVLQGRPVRSFTCGTDRMEYFVNGVGPPSDSPW